MHSEKLTTEDTIKKIVADSIIWYRNKGPLYVNVKISDNQINIYIKGIVTSLGKILICMGELNRVKFTWNEVKSSIYEKMVKEISEKIEKKCSLFYEKTDFIDDSRSICLRIEQDGWIKKKNI